MLFMTQQSHSQVPFTAEVLRLQFDYVDLLPASYHFYEVDGNRRRRRVADPSKNVHGFLKSELSLSRLDEISEHLWFAGARRPPTQLHLQVALGRNIALTDRIDLHLLWNGDGRIFVKPIPRFLLSPDFWRDNLSCVEHCHCFCNSREVAVTRVAGVENHSTIECRQSSITPCKDHLRKVALGFLYTYACLVSSESDFHIAVEKRLLPRQGDDSITWMQWQYLVRELIAQHHPDKIHPRFLRAELRLSRINAIHRTSKLLFAQAYFGGWNNYSSFFRDNLAWIAAITAYMVLILTAMQVGLATEQLQNSLTFQRASYAFTLIAILGPIGLVSLVLLRAVLEFLRDLLVIFKQEKAQITSSA